MRPPHPSPAARARGGARGGSPAPGAHARDSPPASWPASPGLALSLPVGWSADASGLGARRQAGWLAGPGLAREELGRLQGGRLQLSPRCWPGYPGSSPYPKFQSSALLPPLARAPHLPWRAPELPLQTWDLVVRHNSFIHSLGILRA